MTHVVTIEQRGHARVWCSCGWRPHGRITPGPGWADAAPRSKAWIAAAARNVAEQHLRTSGLTYRTGAV
jgi:hypothetical protein